VRAFAAISAYARCSGTDGEGACVTKNRDRAAVYADGTVAPTAEIKVVSTCSLC